jgi:hypothetical protein
MRTLVGTLLVGVCLAASPALAQQHPWVPSGMYTGSVTQRQAPVRAYGRVSNSDIVNASGWRTGKPAVDELYGEACNSGHAVFACPGSGGQ